MNVTVHEADVAPCRVVATLVLEELPDHIGAALARRT